MHHYLAKDGQPSRNDETKFVSNYHDYIVVFARNAQAAGLKKKRKPEILRRTHLSCQTAA